MIWQTPEIINVELKRQDGLGLTRGPGPHAPPDRIMLHHLQQHTMQQIVTLRDGAARVYKSSIVITKTGSLRSISSRTRAS